MEIETGYAQSWYMADDERTEYEIMCDTLESAGVIGDSFGVLECE